MRISAPGGIHRMETPGPPRSPGMVTESTLETEALIEKMREMAGER
jgi:hypothetical protein